MTSRIFFVSGVSGVGKSSILKLLRTSLPLSKYDVRDLDERGVPDGGGEDWLIKETRHWLGLANQKAKDGISTIICGFANPELFEGVHSDTDIPATIILLHANEATIRQRLTGRYPTKKSEKEIERTAGTSLEVFVENCVSFAPKLRKIFETRNMPIIETDGKNPEEVAKEVAELIRQFKDSR